ncbi:MAG: ATP-binding cassette domain-containing protein, partial [Geminicoccaceae bacterium]
MARGEGVEARRARTRGYGLGAVETVLSVDEVAREAAELAAAGPKRERLHELAGAEPLLSIENLNAGYGRMEILHGFSMAVAKGQSLCLIGPNGAGKSTVLHSIYGFTTITAGAIRAQGKDITHLNPNAKLKDAGIAYILQDNSVFPDMTVEENLLMGGYLMGRPRQARAAAHRVLD